MKYRSPLWKALMLAVLPAAVLFATAWLVGRPYGIWMALAEPLILGLGIYGVVWGLMERRPLVAGAIGSSVIAASVMLHEGPTNEVVLNSGSERIRALRGCSVLGKPAEGPVRLLIWTVDNRPQLADHIGALIATHPDIVLLNGTDNPEIGVRLQEALDGEVKFFRGSVPGGGSIAVTRGSFQFCGGEEDEWLLDLPSLKDGGAGAVLGFPYVPNVGVVPLVFARLDSPAGVLDGSDWAKRVVAGAETVATAVRTVGSRGVVLVGDMQTPASAAVVSRYWTASGLSMAATGPNWPNDIAGIPFLSQHALDQVWVGSGWRVQATRVLEIGDQRRSPVMVDLIAAR
jgi:hypothetical protein